MVICRDWILVQIRTSYDFVLFFYFWGFEIWNSELRANKFDLYIFQPKNIFTPLLVLLNREVFSPFFVHVKKSDKMF